MPTVVPLTPEADWLPTLQNLADWELPLVPTLILSPHPDDETLGAGGMIAKLRSQGVPVIVVAITDGESAYADTQNLGDVRAAEQTEALRRLGVLAPMVRRLHLPDRDVSGCEDQLVDLILALIEPGMHLVAPWHRDFHPDHEAAGRAAMRVAQMKNLILTHYLFWTWHRGKPDILEGLSVERLQLTAAELETKLHALEAHDSQFRHADGQPILSPALLMPAQRAYEVYIR
jgi:LmbE family N-acetylglucosaminyl deacetylase